MYAFVKSHNAPTIVSLEMAKKQCRLETTDFEEDEMLQQYIDAAIEVAENYTNSHISEKKTEFVSDDFVNGYKFKITPIQKIEKITYTDTENQVQTLPLEAYKLEKTDEYQYQITFDLELLPKTVKNVKMLVKTGYEVNKTPKAIIQAVLLLVSSFYEKREDTVEKLPKASQSLLSKYQFHY